MCYDACYTYIRYLIIKRTLVVKCMLPCCNCYKHIRLTTSVYGTYIALSGQRRTVSILSCIIDFLCYLEQHGVPIIVSSHVIPPPLCSAAIRVRRVCKQVAARVGHNLYFTSCFSVHELTTTPTSSSVASYLCQRLASISYTISAANCQHLHFIDISSTAHGLCIWDSTYPACC